MSIDDNQLKETTCYDCGKTIEVPKWQDDMVAYCVPCSIAGLSKERNDSRIVRLCKAVDAVISVGHKQSIIAMLKELEPEDWE